MEAEGASGDESDLGVDRLTVDYNEARHGKGSVPHALTLADEFIDRFALLGSAEAVAERLAEIAALGITRIVVVPGSLDADPGLVREAMRASRRTFCLASTRCPETPGRRYACDTPL